MSITYKCDKCKKDNIDITLRLTVSLSRVGINDDFIYTYPPTIDTVRRGTKLEFCSECTEDFWLWARNTNTLF